MLGRLGEGPFVSKLTRRELLRKCKTWLATVVRRTLSGWHDGLRRENKHSTAEVYEPRSKLVGRFPKSLEHAVVVPVQVSILGDQAIPIRGLRELCEKSSRSNGWKKRDDARWLSRNSASQTPTSGWGAQIRQVGPDGFYPLQPVWFPTQERPGPAQRVCRSNSSLHLAVQYLLIPGANSMFAHPIVLLAVALTALIVLFLAYRSGQPK